MLQIIHSQKMNICMFLYHFKTLNLNFYSLFFFLIFSNKRIVLEFSRKIELVEEHLMNPEMEELYLEMINENRD